MVKPVQALPRTTDRQIQILKFIFGEFVKLRTYPTKSAITRNLQVRTNNNGAVLKPLFQKGLMRDLPGRGEYELTALALELLKVRGVKIPDSILSDDKQGTLVDIS